MWGTGRPHVTVLSSPLGTSGWERDRDWGTQSLGQGIYLWTVHLFVTQQLCIQQGPNNSPGVTLKSSVDMWQFSGDGEIMANTYMTFWWKWPYLHFITYPFADQLPASWSHRLLVEAHDLSFLPSKCCLLLVLKSHFFAFLMQVCLPWERCLHHLYK